jgi:hypothetical protein
MEWVFVLAAMVAVWQLGSLARDLWYMLREGKEDAE